MAIVNTQCSDRVAVGVRDFYDAMSDNEFLEMGALCAEHIDFSKMITNIDSDFFNKENMYKEIVQHLFSKDTQYADAVIEEFEYWKKNYKGGSE